MMKVVALSILTWVLTGCMYPLLAAGFGRRVHRVRRRHRDFGLHNDGDDVAILF